MKKQNYILFGVLIVLLLGLICWQWLQPSMTITDLMQDIRQASPKVVELAKRQIRFRLDGQEVVFVHDAKKRQLVKLINNRVVNKLVKVDAVNFSWFPHKNDVIRLEMVINKSPVHVTVKLKNQ